jgi:hypothetical protein
LVKDEDDNLFAASHSILNRWEDYFNQLLNVLGVNSVRQTEMRTAEPLVPEPSCLRLKFLLKSLKAVCHWVLYTIRIVQKKQESLELSGT